MFRSVGIRVQDPNEVIFLNTSRFCNSLAAEALISAFNDCLFVQVYEELKCFVHVFDLACHCRIFGFLFFLDEARKHEVLCRDYLVQSVVNWPPIQNGLYFREGLLHSDHA